MRARPWPIALSYTHLDVYKRQGLRWVPRREGGGHRPGPRASRCVSPRRPAPPGTPARRAGGSRSGSRGPARSPAAVDAHRGQRPADANVTRPARSAGSGRRGPPGAGKAR
ncbi:hypothetical protein NN561_011776 [Cricetulus griseus]